MLACAAVGVASGAMHRLAIASLVTTLAFASSARAQDAAQAHSDAELIEARHSFDVATRAFEAGDYETAVSEFRAALDLSGAADLYFNIYLSEERQGNLEPAADALEQYLEHGTLDAEQGGLLRGRLDRLRARIAAHAPATAAEEPQVLLASPIAVAPSEPPPEDQAPRHDPGSPLVSTSPPVIAIVTLVAAGVLAVNFGIFGGLALTESDRLGGACGHGCLSDQVATLNTYDVVADVSWIGAAVLGVTGLVLLFALPPDTSTEEASVAFAPWMGPTGAGVSAEGTF